MPNRFPDHACAAQVEMQKQVRRFRSNAIENKLSEPTQAGRKYIEECAFRFWVCVIPTVRQQSTLPNLQQLFEATTST
jgi:hypothetical protein